MEEEGGGGRRKGGEAGFWKASFGWSMALRSICLKQIFFECWSEAKRKREYEFKGPVICFS